VNYQSCRSNCWENQSATEPSITIPTISMASLLRTPLWRGAEDGRAVLQRNDNDAAVQ
jgi:hypothetical protein